MQIRTAFFLGLGVAVGTVVGMGVSDETKEQIALNVKKRLVKMLTCEDWEPKKKPDMYDRPTYATFYKKKEAEHNFSYIYSDVLKFDTEEKAKAFIDEAIRFIQVNNEITVGDVCRMQKEVSPYVYEVDTHYGWTYHNWAKAKVEEYDGNFYIRIDDPRYLVHS